MTEPRRDEPLHRLQICPRCAGYMQPLSPVAGEARRHDWKDETFHRSFGGVEVRKFVCEKCHHVATFQIDDLEHIGEDD